MIIFQMEVSSLSPYDLMHLHKVLLVLSVITQTDSLLFPFCMGTLIHFSPKTHLEPLISSFFINRKLAENSLKILLLAWKSTLKLTSVKCAHHVLMY